MNKLDIFKKGVSIVAGYGSSLITYQAIAKNLPPNMNLYQKVAVATASVVMNHMVKDKVKQASDKVIDDYIELYKTGKKEFDELKAEIAKTKKKKDDPEAKAVIDSIVVGS